MAWIKGEVRETLLPFKKVAETVEGSYRTSYSENGGLKKRGYVVYSYCAIRIPSLNVTFACAIERRGEEPKFQLACHQWDSPPPHENTLLVRLRKGAPGHVLDEQDKARPLRRYNADELDDALADWTALAQFAIIRASIGHRARRSTRNALAKRHVPARRRAPNAAHILA
jgi:hypothetical protein